MDTFSPDSLHGASARPSLLTSNAVRTLPKEIQDRVLGEQTRTHFVAGLKDVMSSRHP